MKPIHWIVIAVIVLLVLFLIFYEVGKGKGKTLGKIDNVIAPPTATYQNSTADGKISDVITQFAANLYNDMNGLNWFGWHDTSIYQQVSQLPDGDLVNVFNAFNNNYQKDSGLNLVDWINSQNFLIGSVRGYAATIVSRLAALGAKANN